MHHLLKCLDDQTDPLVINSVHEIHPIVELAPKASRLLPAVISLVFTPFLAYVVGISINGAQSNQTPRLIQDLSVPAVKIILNELSSLSVTPIWPSISAPARTLQGIGNMDHPMEPPGRDASPDQEAIRPNAQPVVPAESGSPSPSSPTTSDSGHGFGQGRAIHRGSSGQTGTSGSTPDFTITPIKRVEIFYQMEPGQKISKEPVVVRITIGDDGLPFQVVVVSGPKELIEKAIKAANQWRFEPLLKHGLKGPQTITLRFFQMRQ